MKINEAIASHTMRLDKVRQMMRSSDRDFILSTLNPASPAAHWCQLLFSMVTPLSEGNTASSPGVANGVTPESVRAVVGLEQRALEGETVFVSQNVMAVVASASQTMEPEPIYATDLLYDRGVLFFEEPLEIADLHPTTGKVEPRLIMPIRAIGWMVSETVHKKDGSIGPGVILTPYTDHDGRVEFRESMRRLADDEKDLYADEEIAGWRPEEPPVRRGLLPSDFLPWAFGVEWSIGEDTQYDYEKMTFNGLVSSVGEIRLFFLSLMRFAWQEIIKTRREVVDRPVRREAKRLIGRDYESGACVLRLRRELQYRPTGVEGSPLKYRVVVRGHWRRQWYRSLGPADLPESHRTIWIDPHIRGDEGLPMRVAHKATAIVR